MLKFIFSAGILAIFYIGIAIAPIIAIICLLVWILKTQKSNKQRDKDIKYLQEQNNYLQSQMLKDKDN